MRDRGRLPAECMAAGFYEGAGSRREERVARSWECPPGGGEALTNEQNGNGQGSAAQANELRKDRPEKGGGK